MTSLFLLLQISQLKIMVTTIQKRCARLKQNDEKFQETISKLPQPQQENVLACLQAAKKFKGQGNRYTTHWIYQCLLLKIKSNSAYNHLRKHKIMALPSPSTLHRYLKKLKPTYGFQNKFLIL